MTNGKTPNRKTTNTVSSQASRLSSYGQRNTKSRRWVEKQLGRTTNKRLRKGR